MKIENAAIVKRLKEIIANPRDEPLDQIGSYIVGATIVQDGIDDLYKEYPLIEEIAELGAELETLGGDSRAIEVFNEIIEKYTILRHQGQR